MKPIPMKYDLTHIPRQFAYFPEVVAIHQPYVDDNDNVHNIRQEFKNRFSGEVDPDNQETVPSDLDMTFYEFIITKPALIAMINDLVDEELRRRGIDTKERP